MKLGIGWTLLLGLSAVAAAAFTDQEMKARFYYDLGPDQVDVTGYPAAAKKGYELFQVSCGRCHTLARPLNSSLTKREDFERYVKRMHMKASKKKGASFSKDEAAAIIEFLTQDAKVRKIEGKAKFDAQTKEIQERFKLVEAERERLEAQKALERAKTQTDPAGVHPQPSPDERR